MLAARLAGAFLALVLDGRLGLGVRFDPKGENVGWEKRLAHLAQNHWLEVDNLSPEIYVRSGRRSLRAVSWAKIGLATRLAATRTRIGAGNDILHTLFARESARPHRLPQDR